MDNKEEIKRLQVHLQRIAYRMLGSVSEAEDVVQDVWLRWHGADQSAVENAEAWLVSTTIRRSIDLLRAAKTRREQYVGIWLPEPVLSEAPDSPERLQEMSGDISVALLVLLERLSPETRAAFLLREVFDAEYSEVASALGKTEAACRQIVHRAKAQLNQERTRYLVAPEDHQRLMKRFADALSGGDFRGLKAMLAEKATLVGDGGGIVNSFKEPMRGGERIAQLFYAPSLRNAQDMRIQLAWINDRWGVLRFFNDKLESVQSYETDGERITEVYVQRNPEKLKRVEAALARRR
ncbi:MAG: RNA polymerase sigma-70 factor [Pseudoxanthomonas sp.]